MKKKLNFAPLKKKEMNFISSAVNYKSAIIRSVLAIIIGVLFCIFPNDMAGYSVILLGAVILLGGIISFAANRIYQRNTPISNSGLIQLVLTLLIGMLVIFQYEFFAKFIMYCLGFLLIVGGGGQFAIILGSRRILKAGIPFTAYLMPLVLMAVGLLVCFNPFQSQEILFIIFGISAIFYGVNDLFTQIRLRKALKKMGKVIRNGDVEDVDFEEVK